MQNRVRNTPQRQLVLKVVNASHDHPDAQTIYERCKAENPTISMGTVYRNLSVLTKEKEILHLTVPEGPDHYDFNTAVHCHFHCCECGSVFDIEEPENFKLTNEITVPGCEVYGHQLVVFGVCRKCLEKRKTID